MSTNQLPLLPSSVGSVCVEHVTVTLVILYVVEAQSLRIPLHKLSLVHRILWATNGSGLFDGVYAKWDSTHMNH